MRLLQRQKIRGLTVIKMNQRRWQVFWISLISVGLFILFVEVRRSFILNEKEVQRSWLEQDVWDESLFRYRPSRDLTMVGKRGDEIIYHYVQKIDAWGNRQTPQTINQDESRGVVAFLGCSFVEGVGVSDESTIPAHFARHHPELYVVNYGKGGWGPGQNYLLMQQEFFKKQLSHPRILGLHIFYDFHIERTRLSSETLMWAWSAPYFKLDRVSNNEPILNYQGRFNEAKPWPFIPYFWLSKMTWFQKLHPSLLPRTDADLELVSVLLIETARSFKRAHPGSQFVTIFMHPEEPGSKKIKQMYAKSGEALLELHYRLDGEKHQIPHDGHLNEQGTQLIAEQIRQQIKNWL